MTIEPINNWARKIRKKQIEKEKSKQINQPISSWKDEILINGETFDSLTIILRTKGCRWAKKGGCSMCGYFHDATPSVDQKNIINQFNEVLNNYEFEDEFYVKIFTSGSFLDNKEISKKTRNKIIHKLNQRQNFRGLSIETRPEFVERKKLSNIREKINELIIGIGLESASDEIREECINKGFSFDEYKSSLLTSLENDVEVKTYLLLKPPFLSEKDSIKDSIKSAKKASKLGSSKISINPCNIQRGTIVEELYEQNEYSPPWLWSLIRVLRQTTKLDTDIITDPVAAGKERGIHNCQRCDERILKKIKKFTKTQEPRELEVDYCGCKEEWKKILEKENRSHNITTSINCV
ncbi:TIGR01210 family radical SAM protein [archaeon SCG-AAA382B04]|nr:TIGR01210 family radical SAM protein [archaeon SCG-AAA382B04]